MDQKQLISNLKTTIEGLSQVLGPDYELVVHDLKSRKLVYIIHGEITGRKEGYKMPVSVYDSVLNISDETHTDYLAGYASHSLSGKSIRASHIIYRDEANKPVAMICINQDVSKIKDLISSLDSMISLKSINETATINVLPEDENYIQKMSQQVILDAIEKLKPSNLETKEKRLEVIKSLDAKGVFTVKNAVPIVCKTLDISQATLYNYLREVRNGNTF